MKPDSALPAWFYENCVRTPNQVAQHAAKLVVREDDSAPRPTRGPDRYEIEAFVLEALAHRILRPGDESFVSVGGGRPARPLRFAHDSILLRLPGQTANAAQSQEASATKTAATSEKPGTGGKETGDGDGSRQGGQDFLTAVVETMAQRLDAELVTLTIEDIRDLSEHIVLKRLGKSAQSDDRPFVEILFTPMNINLEKYEGAPVTNVAQPAPKSGRGLKGKLFSSKPTKTILDVEADAIHGALDSASLKGHGLFETAFKAAVAKRRQKGAQPQPMIIHIPDIFHYTEEGEYRMVFQRLRSTLKELHESSPDSDFDVIVIATTETAEAPVCEHTDCSTCQIADSKLLSMLSTKPSDEPFSIFPVKSPAQKRLFQQDTEDQTEAQNIRELKRCLRLIASSTESPLLQPYTPWELPSDDNARKVLRSAPLGSPESIAQTIGKAASLERIREIVGRPYKYNMARTQWLQDNSIHAFSWESTLSPDAREVIRRVQSSERYEFESQLLDTIVDPTGMDESWDDIEVEPRVKAKLSHMISLSSGDTASTAYGVLKKNLIKGALVYGPPGTGKTHLARVLAKESGILMFLVSAADIESKWHGETEKHIKALFNLGKMLTPSLIFIDEADALFRRRHSDDKRDERKWMNQFLGEIDGLGRNNKAPFLMLATNTPGDIDHALLRRVPGRFYLGHPSTRAREQIFRILLREEQLHADANLALLAEKGDMYTGSDIRTICVQAAMSCEEELMAEGLSARGQRRLIRMHHLQQALENGSPVGPSLDLTEIAKFASEFDPSALGLIEDDLGRQRAQQERSAILSRSTTLQASPASSQAASLAEADMVKGQELSKGGIGAGAFALREKLSTSDVTLVELSRPGAVA
ncbi:AAA-domain-containing protein [Thozetella sp. PMI_491]|nr:AAA-domain-containing protein [Thozetella sp. PMI_491]